MKKLFIFAIMLLFPLSALSQTKNNFIETDPINDSYITRNVKEIPWRIYNGEEYIINPENRMIRIYIDLPETSNSILVACHGGVFTLMPGAVGACNTNRIIKLISSTTAYGTYFIKFIE